MTKNSEFQKQLVEVVKEGIKPSTIKKLKRSKSADDLTNSPPIPLLQDQLKAKQTEIEHLRQKNEDSTEQIKGLQEDLAKKADHILELRLQNIKDFGKYREQLKAVENDLTSQIQTDQQEIKELEKRVNLLTKERTRLSRDKSLAELRLSNLELGESNNNSD